MADDERLACGVDDFGGDRLEVVDLEDPVDLGEQARDQAKVAAGGPGDCCDRFGVGEVLGGQAEVEASVVVGEDEAQFVGLSDL